MAEEGERVSVLTADGWVISFFLTCEELPGISRNLALPGEISIIITIIIFKIIFGCDLLSLLLLLLLDVLSQNISFVFNNLATLVHGI